jgi:hypothetical protein
MGRIVGIVLVMALLGFGIYKIAASSVDRKDRDAVGKAFLQQLKKEELGKARKYYIPAEADAWETATHDKLLAMKTNAMAAFRDSIPDEPTFAVVPTNKLPKGTTGGDTWVQAGDTVLGMRQIDGDWYVSKSNQP